LLFTTRPLTRTATVSLAALLIAAPALAQVTRVANTTLQMPADVQPAGYTLQAAFGGLTFTAPIAFATPPNETNRTFVVERAGRIRVINNLSTTPTISTFLDITPRVVTGGEEGLLSLAFHPNYASNGQFYIFYSTTATGVLTERISRFKVSSTNANVADMASEQILIDQPDDFSNHQGSDLHFGSDGYLYVSLGDEGGGNNQGMNAQHIDKDFFSAIMRIDVDRRAGNLTPNAHPAMKTGTYSIPADNPFVGATSFNGAAVTASKVRTEFWAVGFRNPWRFTFDSATGELWVGDVGQSAREEIDLVQKGKNYGWDFREGFIPGPNTNPVPAGVVFTDPVLDYPPTDGKSIIGGVVYHGSQLPELAGKYIFGDYVTGNLWVLNKNAGVYSKTKIFSNMGLNSFGVDPQNGDVLISNLTTNSVNRLVHSPPTGNPPAKLSQTGAFQDLVTLTPNAGIVPYEPKVTFWSDYALKTRWFSIPDTTKTMTFATDSNWTFPTGTVWVKHFELETERGNPASRRRLETRFLVKSASGVYGLTYKWNSTQTDADLVDDAGFNEDIPVTVNGVSTIQTWRYPSRGDCVTCHNAAPGYSLGFTTRQLNTVYNYDAGSNNQLTALANAGYFSNTVPSPSTLPTLATAGDTTQSIESRARSYLQANCSQCHQPGGPGLGNWDARISTALSSAGIINGSLINNGGDAANMVVVPVDTGHSMMLRRMQALPNAPRMPPIATSQLDQTGIDLITNWVNSLPPAPTDYVREAEALTNPAPTTSGQAVTNNVDSVASGGTWIGLAGTATAQWIEFTLPGVPAGSYDVKLAYKKNNNRAIVKLTVDGVQVGATLDQFASSGGYLTTTFGAVTFNTTGDHKIRLTTTGKNASSGGFTVSADKFTLAVRAAATNVINEAENLAFTSTPAATKTTDPAASAGTWVSFPATAVGQFIDFPVPNVPAGTYSVRLHYKAHPNRGILSLKVDGTQVGGTLDEFSATAGYKDQTFGNVTFGATGTHTIRLTVTGKNPSAGNMTLSADRFDLLGQ
jgi:uncharacterized repeat protein (TIGR03806 family)